MPAVTNKQTDKGQGSFEPRPGGGSQNKIALGGDNIKHSTLRLLDWPGPVSENSWKYGERKKFHWSNVLFKTVQL